MARRCSNLEFKELEQALGLDPTSPPTKKSKDEEPKDHGWETYQCTLVTPLYGGGVEAGKIDLQMPIRASEIRGHLRFWWRVLYGNFSSQEASKKTFEKECAIWGGIGKEGATKSKVEIRVSNSTEGAKIKTKTPFGYDWGVDKKTNQKKLLGPRLRYGHEYILFPFRDSTKKTPNDHEQENEIAEAGTIQFSLHVRFSEDRPLSEQQADEVNEALRWWASFGGVGSRTRRGLGAVKVDSNPKCSNTLEPIMKEEVQKRNGKLKLSEDYSDKTIKGAFEVWKNTVDLLMEFRQGYGTGRNYETVIQNGRTKKFPKRSFWPEANAIRELSGCHLPKHHPRGSAENADNEPPAPNSFPRAAFGLPIIFHFKDSPAKDADSDTRKDPIDHTLEPSGLGLQRMASPLILRPYWNGSAWQGAALLIPNWEKALELELEFSSEKERLKKDKPKNYQDYPNHWNNTANLEKDVISERMKKISTTKDPLTAFLDFFEKGN